eukprot:scaffold389730_cov39-Prasinocladus_malaysianus.AAC.1
MFPLPTIGFERCGKPFATSSWHTGVVSQIHGVTGMPRSLLTCCLASARQFRIQLDSPGELT